MKYNKLLEIIYFDFPLLTNNNLDDIHLSKDNLNYYEPEILFSIRKSIEQLNLNSNYNINTIRNYIEIIPKGNNNFSYSENNTTIINNNTIYSFDNNNNDIENKKNKEKYIDKNNNKQINQTLKKKKFGNKTVAVGINERIKNIDKNPLIKSENLSEFIKRIKDKKNFSLNDDYSEEEIKHKYLASKLLIKYFTSKISGNNYFIFKNLKALYLINQTNKVDNQINLFIKENEEE